MNIVHMVRFLYSSGSVKVMRLKTKISLTKDECSISCLNTCSLLKEIFKFCLLSCVPESLFTILTFLRTVWICLFSFHLCSTSICFLLPEPEVIPPCKQRFSKKSGIVDFRQKLYFGHVFYRNMLILDDFFRPSKCNQRPIKIIGIKSCI